MLWLLILSAPKTFSLAFFSLGKNKNRTIIKKVHPVPPFPLRNLCRVSGMYRQLREFIQRLQQQQPLDVQQHRPPPPEEHGRLLRLSIIPQIHLIMEAAVIMAIVTVMTRRLAGLRSHVRPQNVHHLHPHPEDFSPVYQMFLVVKSENLLAQLYLIVAEALRVVVALEALEISVELTVVQAIVEVYSVKTHPNLALQQMLVHIQ